MEETMKERILQYIKYHPGCDGVDMAIDMKIYTDIAYRLIDSLIEEQKIIKQYIGLETQLRIKE